MGSTQPEGDLQAPCRIEDRVGERHDGILVGTHDGIVCCVEPHRVVSAVGVGRVVVDKWSATIFASHTGVVSQPAVGQRVRVRVCGI